MHECHFCTRTFRTRKSCEQHMNDTNHWSFECDTCTREFSSQHAKEQHMTALSHWTRPYQTSQVAANIRPTLSFMSTWGHSENETKENSITNYNSEIPEIRGLDCHQQELISSIASMFNQTAHADITMLIQNVSLPAHRSIICPQSSYLEEMCRQAFSRDERVVDCDQGSGAAYWRVFEYLYTGDYSELLRNTELEDDPGLLKHLRVYALADLFCMEDLKEISMSRMKRTASEKWDCDLFLTCIKEVYQSVPEFPPILRSALLDMAVVHALELTMEEEFKEIVYEGGDFVVEYVERLL